MNPIRRLFGRWPCPKLPPDLPPYILRDIGLMDGCDFYAPESIRACNKPVYVFIALGHLFR